MEIIDKNGGHFDLHLRSNRSIDDYGVRRFNLEAIDKPYVPIVTSRSLIGCMFKIHPSGSWTMRVAIKKTDTGEFCVVPKERRWEAREGRLISILMSNGQFAFWWIPEKSERQVRTCWITSAARICELCRGKWILLGRENAGYTETETSLLAVIEPAWPNQPFEWLLSHAVT
jgi:hypothetical protein